ncbi:hypothetical protein HON36_01280 [Candidatus Parcubacteria bacterium]|jgi:cytochrome b involved in lipid metabolism|nr:hypothetical protein [Candidatus Parcubacteria bacterium]MBT7228038.1 hypothetical protein [Candidatus Parcubacteria bacterium]
MRYIILSVLGIFLFSGCGLFGGTQPAPENNAVDVRPQGYQPPDNGDVPEFDTSKPGAVEQTKFSMIEIAKHNSAKDCWLLIDSKVYDVTTYIAGAKHPGGAAILEGCGKANGTELFDTRPMGSGTPHSDKARSFLPNFYIGDFQE